jgi:tyrosine-specific transport protein
MKYRGPFIGGVLLVMGSCIGAGMLAMPIVTGRCGLIPSIVMFLIAWGFMTCTGLFMVEVMGSFQQRANIVSMANRSFGVLGKVVSSALYLFLFYALLVAYICGIEDAGSTYFRLVFPYCFPFWALSTIVTGVFGLIVYGGTGRVDYWNRFFMVGKIVAYIAMVMFGMFFIKAKLLSHMEPKYAVLSLPALVIAFGYHNMIPTLIAYMEGDVHRTKKIILIGSFLALIVYVIWQIVVLGIVPVWGSYGIVETLSNGGLASDAIAGVLGKGFVSFTALVLTIFALLSSFLVQALALVHFLADFWIVSSKKPETSFLCCLAFVPPLIFSFIYPNYFIAALNFAGGFCAVILFGVFPALMVWKLRYVQRVGSSYRVWGGKKLLSIVIAVAITIVFVQLFSMFNWI